MMHDMNGNEDVRTESFTHPKGNKMHRLWWFIGQEKILLTLYQVKLQDLNYKKLNLF